MAAFTSLFESYGILDVVFTEFLFLFSLLHCTSTTCQCQTLTGIVQQGRATLPGCAMGHCTHLITYLHTFTHEYTHKINSLHFLQEIVNVTVPYGVFVRIRAGIDYITGEASWDLQALDPVTGIFLNNKCLQSMVETPS